MQSHLLSNLLSIFIPICLSHVQFHWNYTSQYSQLSHLSDGDEVTSLKFFLIYLLPLVWSPSHFSWLVFFLSLIPHVLRQSPSKIPLHLSEPFLWCTSRFRPWPTSFHSLHNFSWLCHLKELKQIPPLCWWYPVIPTFLSPSNSTSWTLSLVILKYLPILSLTYTLLDEL